MVSYTKMNKKMEGGTIMYGTYGSYGCCPTTYGYAGGYGGGFTYSFAFILVLFILLVIIGYSGFIGRGYGW